MTERRGSALEREFLRRALRALALLAVVVAATAAAWYGVWQRTSSHLRSELEGYTRQEALALARTLLYDLAGDGRLVAIRELEELSGPLPEGGAKPAQALVDLVGQDPTLPDALVWERAQRAGMKVDIRDVSSARRALYAQNLRRNAESLEEDLWARVTLSDHLRGVRLTSETGATVISVGAPPPASSKQGVGPLVQETREGRGTLAVTLPLHIGLRKWGEVACVLDRSEVGRMAGRVQASARAGHLLLAGAGILLLALLVAIGYGLQRGLRREIVDPVIQLARRMESWEQAPPPPEGDRPETVWLSDAFDRLLGRVQSLLAERDAALGRVRSQQEELLKAERLGLLERVGAGLSHELNNALHPAWLRLEEIRLEGRTPDDEDLESLRDHLASARGILRDLGSTTRRSVAPPRPVDPEEWLGVALRLVEPHFRTGPHLQVPDLADLPAVLGDPQALVQCAVNLLLNGRDASVARRGPAGKVSLDARVQAEHLVVGFEDDGPGVPPELRGRLFEPFVTSKEHGSGLGLFLVATAAKGMGGWIHLAREGPGFTRFELGIPLAEGSGPSAGGAGGEHGG